MAVVRSEYDTGFGGIGVSFDVRHRFAERRHQMFGHLLRHGGVYGAVD